MRSTLQDLRYALRQLRRAPGFTVVAVLSLGLGLGATTTVLCWMQNLLWRPLPGVAEQDRLAILVSSRGGGNISLSDARDFGRMDDTFVDVAASQTTPASVTVDRQTEWQYGQVVTANFFDLLGVRPIVGRTFLPDEDSRPGGNPVVVISETCWRRRFAADPSISGRTVQINRHPFAIVGVVPAEFKGTMTGLAFDFWAPISMDVEVSNRHQDSLTSRDSRGFHNVARLQPRVGLAQAQAAVGALDAQLAEAYPRTNEDVHHRVVSMADCPYGAQSVMGSTLRLLLAVCLVVLLIVAVNLSNLLLGRVLTRRKEIAIRLATGAHRWRVVRQLTTESICLALLGGAAGVGLATWMVSLLHLFLPSTGIARNLALSFHLDAPILGLALILSLAMTIVFGLLPAIHASRPRLNEALKEGGRSSGASSSHALRSLLVVSEMALAVTLLVAAGLCIKGLGRARAIDVGFDRDNVLIADLQVGMNGYTEETATALYRRIQERLAALPEVREASLASWFPLGLSGCKGLDAFVEGYDPPPGEDPTYEYARISPGYFASMGIQLLEGRDFAHADDGQAPPVAIVNEHFAQRFWPGQQAVGRRFRSHGTWRTVVGVARAGKYNRLDEKAWPFFYLPYRQGVPDMDLSAAVRTTVEPSTVARAVERAIHEIDPAVDVLGTKTLAAHTEAVFFTQRIASTLLALLGAVGVVLACMGVYAVTTYNVNQRTREFGLRVAVGASQRELLHLVLRRGLLLAASGSVAGLVVAGALAQMLSGFLYGVSPFDPQTLLVVPLLLGVVTLVACLVPARRAARVDPMEALRCE